ncbi:divalent metal cation transporter [Lentisphaera profundi]|uniref:Divalent metal cation transporter n=1 Tax=Lentisphaera profundi TaxID=1658616 RepID=A0ABY7VRN9_9BACT|nr:divalent metal cation transporter [Lentisphaera profundi]WDE95531.1 divalent metal cation transporter [Lentisphaera profundi]
MSDKVSKEVQMLDDAHAAGTGAVVKTYMKLSGPGWLQSAITLGGGSLASALFLGVIGGVEFLWVQLVAMAMGVIMLSAISYVTLSTEKSPFKSMKDNINPVLAWGWLLASLMANMIWVLPQYSLAYSAMTQNLFPSIPNPESMTTKLIITAIIFAFSAFITMCYGKQGKGMKIYENLLKITVAAIVLCFMIVAGKLIAAGNVGFGEILKGFIPNFNKLFKPASEIQAVINQIADPAARAFWTQNVVQTQRDIMVSAAATAVGINMTFLLPFSMLNKGWGKKHRGLAIFDLSTGMVIPYVLATSCVAIAAAVTFHAKPFEGLTLQKDGIVQIVEGHKQAPKIQAALEKRTKLVKTEIDNDEILLASMLVKRDTKEFPKALEVAVGPKMAHIIFGFGVLAMALSTISMLMLISGFVVCEMFGFEHGGKAHKRGTLLATTGVLWPFIWGTGSGTYLAIITSTFGYILLPVAFLAFFMMMNSKKVLGENIPKGNKRVIWNVLTGLSLVITGVAAGHTAWNKTMTVGDTSIAFGKYFLIIFIILVIIGQIYIMNKHKKEALAKGAGTSE